MSYEQLPLFNHQDQYLALIEITAHTKIKYEMWGEFLYLDRVLNTVANYPANYGYFPSTLAPDGDPLDVLVYCSQPIIPTTVVAIQPITTLALISNGVRDDKVVAQVINDPQPPPPNLKLVEQFYRTYKDLSQDPPQIQSWLDLTATLELIEDSYQRYLSHQPEVNEDRNF